VTPADPGRLDDVDRRLLRILQADGRASYAAMAGEVGLSAPAVRLRVQRLIDDGVLDVVGVSDPIALGFPVMAMVAVSAGGDIRVVADRIAGIENVIYLVLTSGEHDLLVEVVCRTPDELLDVVNDRIRAVPGVQSTRVWQYYGIHTHRFTWGVPDGPAERPAGPPQPLLPPPPIG
jgi:Lrp/AsnC family transcriptional regulator for asnA, asnC and gidA